MILLLRYLAEYIVITGITTISYKRSYDNIPTCLFVLYFMGKVFACYTCLVYIIISCLLQLLQNMIYERA